MTEKQILDSWKEIAAYLKRSEKTCRRLEHELGLPVHRLEESPRARVFAYKEEIDRWIKATQHSEKESFFGKLGHKKLLIPALIAVIIAIIAMAVWLLVPQARIPSDFFGRSATESSYMQVTYDGSASEPAISPDGLSVAYVTRVPGQNEKLMLQDLSAGKAIELFKEYRIFGSPRWSPDGSELLFQTVKEDGSGAALLVSRLGKAFPFRRLLLARRCWSPDGNQIASTTTSAEMILVTNRSTADLKSILLSGTRWLGDVDWARKSNLILISTRLDNGRCEIWTVQPDGKVVEEKEIAGNDGRQSVWVFVQPDDSQLQKVVGDEEDVCSPRWSGTGDAIYYLRPKGSKQELVKVPIDAGSGTATGFPQVLLSDADIQGDFTLSADNSMAFTRGVSHSNLWIAEFTDIQKDQKPQIKPLTTGAAQRTNPSISPNGKWIAFASSGNIYKIPIDGGPQTQLTFSDSMNDSPVWSPDGKWIACGSLEGEARNILLIDADAGSSVQLTSSTKKLYGPVWSPDANRLAYGIDESGECIIWTIDISDGNPKQLAEIQWSDTHFLSWAPGRNILFQTPGNQNFMILDPETGEQKPLVRNSVGYPFYPKYSPDSKKVAVWWNRRGNDKRYDGGIWTVSFSDNTETCLFPSRETLSPVGWSQDGSMVYAIAQQSTLRNNSLLTIPAEGGDPGTLFTLPGIINEVSISPDGQKFVCSMIESKSDVWIMENFDPDQQ